MEDNGYPEIHKTMVKAGMISFDVSLILLIKQYAHNFFSIVIFCLFS